MYISHIKLSKIRCFDDFEINLEDGDQHVKWTTVLGNNATGKSTLFRSIAIGLCDESSAAGLLKESEHGYIRHDEQEAIIEIVLKDGNLKNECCIKTTIKKVETEGGKTSFEQLRQEVKGKLPWNDLFVCIYGTGRGVSGTGDVTGYSVINAVYNIFNYSEGLQNPELALRRMGEDKQTEFFDALKNILDLNPFGDIILTKTGLKVDGRWGNDMPLRDLADGYKSTFYWITDLFGWAVSFDPTIKNLKDVKGIVMIDELEQHLHPSWQRFIIKRLRKELKNVQFIVSTHSPLIVLGTADLDNAMISSLKLDGNSAKNEEEKADVYKGMRVDQVLTSSAFDLPIARSGETGDMVLRFQKLILKEELSEIEISEFDNLKKKIKKLPDVYETMENLRIHKEIRDLIKKNDK
ncbi:MAG: AAA family ATPase [Nitrosopumilus sp.]